MGPNFSGARLRVSSMIGLAAPNTASVTITSDPLTACAGTPTDSKYSAISSDDNFSPIATASSTDFGGRSPRMRTP